MREKSKEIIKKLKKRFKELKEISDKLVSAQQKEQKLEGNILKEQKKRIKELSSASSTRDILDKILVRSLVHIFTENDKERGDKNGK